jgi:pyrroloquinoline quinone (PQQ) biosynthesis protein C
MGNDGITALELESQALVHWLDAHPLGRRLFDGLLDTEEYTAFLVQTYHYVLWTTPLLARAGARLNELGRHPALAALLTRKAAEERGHEHWVLADLKGLGWDPSVVKRVAPSPSVAAYVAWNRFTVESGSATAFLGTAYVLESLSTHRAGRAAKRLVAHAGIPHIERAVGFLRGHSDSDTDHLEGLTAVLRTLDDPLEQQALALSARTTRVLYQGLFGEGFRLPEDALPALSASA